MDVLDACRKQVRGRDLRVVLPEAGDERVLAAASRLVAEDLARPVLLEEAHVVHAKAKDLGLSIDGAMILNPATDARLTALADALAGRRERLGQAAARRLMQKPFYFGGGLVASGEAAAMVAGATCPTRRVIEAALMTIGLADGISVPSSFFLMHCPNAVSGVPKHVVLADCAVNVDPDPDELAGIAIASARSARGLFRVEPRVAMLSFSTHGSAVHPHVDKVRRALERVRKLEPNLAIDGELQADAALSALVAGRKAKATAGGELASNTRVAGAANVLVFPDLDAGNIAYKLVQYLGGAQAIGPFLQGFALPVSDLSRGASVEDIVACAVVTLALGTR